MKCHRLFIALFSSALFASQAASAATITLNAIQDTMITNYTSGSLNTTPLNNQLINVRGGSNSAGSSSPTKRYGVLEFDLSSVNAEITGATLQLYMLPGTLAEANNGTTSAFAVGLPLTAHIDEATLAWSGTNAYTTRADLGPGEVILTDLGDFAFSGPVPTGQYYASSPASLTDLAFLNARAANAFPFVGFLLNPNSTSSLQWHQWSDHESGFAAQLVLTIVPEPSSCFMTIVGLSYCAFLARRKKDVV